MIVCDVCGYTTQFQSYLARHRLKHSDDRPYCCNYCDTRFKTNSAYLLHVRERHCGTRYACPTCGAAFSQQRTLERHLLCHQEERTFACDLCTYTCKRKQDLACHKTAMHDSGKVRRKRQEESVAQLCCSLRVPYTREFRVHTSTFGTRKSARIDFQISMHWGWLLFEVDEMAHSKYSISDECMRMLAIANYLTQKDSRMRLHFVRYNSHAYKENGTILRPTQEERAAHIKDALLYVPDAAFVITYLFYRSVGGKPAITFDPEYTLSEHVRIA